MIQDRCAETVAGYFEHRQLIIASNRAPVTFDYGEDDHLKYTRGTGGLVTALTSLAQHIRATWIACAQTEGDRLWREGQVPFRADAYPLNICFIQPGEAAYDGYYNVISNPLLWFLQHSMWDVSRTPVITRATWEAWEKGYRIVNHMFAQEIVRFIRSIDRPSLVMLQDYHLYLVGQEVRSLLRATRPPTRTRRRTRLLHFVHIPWPGPDYWGILPAEMRESILQGLCGVDLLGFQTEADGLAFIRTCESYLPGALVNFKRGRVRYLNRVTHVRDFPISIDVEELRQFASTEEVARYIPEIRNIAGDRRLILRIDRIDPSKNIVRGFQAFEEMLELFPEHRGQVKFIALLVPSRMGVDEYQDYLAESMAAAGRVNALYGDSEWEPVRVLVGDNYARAVAALQLYDVLLVNSIADGMNLVAKEGVVVNQREGVLILSERTGAEQQLKVGAKIIPPCDVYATALALHNALDMTADERKDRALWMRELVEREDIHHWLCQQIDLMTEISAHES
jgi:trehalose 6-phosphate synthase